MKIFEHYFCRHPVVLYPDFPVDTDLIVCIPVLNDPDIFATIDSLSACGCKEGQAGVLIVVNHGENSSPAVKAANYQLSAELKEYAGRKNRERQDIVFRIAEIYDLPAKYAGVGLARKIAMDAAAYFFWQVGKPDCPIASLDADTWVRPDYPDELVRCFRCRNVAGVSVAYAHRLDAPFLDEGMREAMIKYELYLRYYLLAMRYTGHPYAFHCIGSAFAVRCRDYVAQGGMNKRQAGEDFYFLQKLIATGRYATLNTTQVYPSPRFSDRTPFGTGQALKQIVRDSGNYPVYHIDAFRALKFFFEGIHRLYKAPENRVAEYFEEQAVGLREFLAGMDGRALLAEINANCASPEQFKKRFFDQFNAFRVLKYLNYVHGTCYQKVDILEAVMDLFSEMQYSFSGKPREDLEFLRKL